MQNGTCGRNGDGKVCRPLSLAVPVAHKTEALLVNTGCMIVRCDQPWATKVWFDDLNGVEQRADGKWYPVVKSEDWHFSHRVAQEGGKVMATRLIKLHHRGSVDFRSTQAWGKPRDLDY